MLATLANLFSNAAIAFALAAVVFIADAPRFESPADSNPSPKAVAN